MSFTEASMHCFFEADERSQKRGSVVDIIFEETEQMEIRKSWQSRSREAALGNSTIQSKLINNLIQVYPVSFYSQSALFAVRPRSHHESLLFARRGTQHGIRVGGGNAHCGRVVVSVGVDWSRRPRTGKQVGRGR